jgi:hypothetical protein
MLPADLTDGVATQEGDRDAEVLWRGRTHIEGGAVDRNAGRTSVGRHDLWPLLTNPLNRWQPSHEVRFRAMPKPAPMTDTGAKQPGGRKWPTNRAARFRFRPIAKLNITASK